MILGAILAGGRSQRFGSDKAAALLDGRALIDHVADALAPHVDGLIVCGRAHERLECVSDRPSGDLGPLGGLDAALDHARTNGFDHVVTLPCDTPLIDPDLVPALLAHGGPAILSECPVIGIWPATLAPALDHWLATSDDRSIRAWARSVGAGQLALPAPVNVNRVADLDRLG
ncbi:molybdenum cofactor guanylyltransferase [Sphingomonas sp.]|jgi:molybdopterin-guanine dinucleotide biosynthesis protein A|uniref:molybdenum cofactor guanylyltransferase n=1 Tax=Sphingomonas sp. TaxID=28214 RepID=UPI002E32FD60|nr:NTP transferase domain-containing protein [Sphingomonas sp.]HEX4693088.1 NTP transferase domain-containing protein [Sphingomonas sp.]